MRVDTIVGLVVVLLWLGAWVGALVLVAEGTVGP